MPDEKRTYAKEWQKSASHFYENEDYSWMSSHITLYKNVLEIGCGTGQSTLQLLNMGHKVIAVEKNEYCLDKAKELIESKGYKYSGTEQIDVSFLHYDIMNTSFLKTINELDFDVVICWNVGSYWGRSMIDYYLPYMLDYGLSYDGIINNPESSYAELILWCSCKIAQSRLVPCHIVERVSGKIDSTNDTYYKDLKQEIEYGKIIYNNRKTITKSSGGRMLISNVDNKVLGKEDVEILLLSVLITH